MPCASVHTPRRRVQCCSPTPLPSFRAVAAAVASREVGVLPIESSLIGPSARRTTWCGTRLSRSSGRPCFRSGTFSSGRRRCRSRTFARLLAFGRARPVSAAVARLARATVIAMPTTADAANHVAERGVHGEVAIVTARRSCTSSRCSRSRSSPTAPAGCAPPRGRALRTTCICFSSSRARFRRRRDATAWTRSSWVIHARHRGERDAPARCGL